MHTASTALHTIDRLPLDPGFPLFRHYAAMKVGVRESVRYYASLLAAAAERIMAESGSAGWVVTAPPLYVLPAGANLMAWELCRMLALRSVDLRYTLPYADAGPTDYSATSVESRVANRRELHEGEGRPRPDPQDFHGREVLCVNDINVTGTQQRFLEQTLAPLQPAGIHWLYVVQVEPELGRSHPEVENALNTLHLATTEEFADVLARADIDYTSRCMARLFRLSGDELEGLLRSLDTERRARLYRLACEEGKYAGHAVLARLAESVNEG